MTDEELNEFLNMLIAKSNPANNLLKPSMIEKMKQVHFDSMTAIYNNEQILFKHINLILDDPELMSKLKVVCAKQLLVSISSNLIHSYFSMLKEDATKKAEFTDIMQHIEKDIKILGDNHE